MCTGGVKSTGKNWRNQRRPLSGLATFDLLVLALARRMLPHLPRFSEEPTLSQAEGGRHGPRLLSSFATASSGAIMKAEVPSVKSQISRSVIPTLRNRESVGQPLLCRCRQNSKAGQAQVSAAESHVSQMRRDMGHPISHLTAFTLIKAADEGVRGLAP